MVTARGRFGGLFAFWRLVRERIIKKFYVSVIFITAKNRGKFE